LVKNIIIIQVILYCIKVRAIPGRSLTAAVVEYVYTSLKCLVALGRWKVERSASGSDVVETLYSICDLRCV